MEKQPVDDRSLITQIRSGNELAFKQVYHRYNRQVYTYALRILKSEHIAEEVMQECMLKIWNILRSGSDIENLEAYFRVSTKNISLNALRKIEIDSRAKQVNIGNWEEGHIETEEAILLNDTRRILEEAIQLLPPQQMRVFQLCNQQGYTYDEAAQQLGISPKTVKVHMKFALRFVREYIKKANDLLILLIIFKLI